MRRLFNFPWWLAAVLLVPAAALPAANSRQPNLLLIVSDDQGYPDLGCLGRKKIITPNLDRLAKEGVRATDFYLTWPACTPSRSGILTGRYPQRNGLYAMIRNDLVNYGYVYSEQEYALSPEMTLGLDVREVVIAQPLKAAGYATGCVGKWDSGRAKRFLPLQRGFDFFYGFANTGIDYWTHERYGVPSMFRGNERTTADKGTYATDLFRREALSFIRSNKDKPFFLYLPFNAPHGASAFAPGLAPRESKKKGERAATEGVQAPEKFIKMYPDLDPKDGLTKYYACVTCMDEAIGEILDTLRDLKLEQDTLVVFFSDNGGSGNGGNAPLKGGKSSLWEGGIRSFLLARWPGRLPAGTVTGEFLTSLEVFPTFLSAAGTKPPPGLALDGFDMLPILQGKQPSPRKEMFWQQGTNVAARVENWKWLKTEKGSGLYDLTTDLGETKDLSQAKPDVLSRVESRFQAWRKEMDECEPRGPFRDY